MMDTTVLISLSGQQLHELIESSVRKALQVQPVPKPDDTDTLLDTKEAAQLIKYKETSIYGLVKRKKIPFCKIEGKLLFSRQKLLEWVANGHNEISGKLRREKRSIYVSALATSRKYESHSLPEIP